MNLKDTYNKIAEQWKKNTNNVEWMEDGINTFILKLGKGSSVLDVGCGTGNKSAYLSDKGLQVVGIDFSEKMIDVARHDVPNASFEVLDVTNVDKLARKFDGIFARAVLLHFPKKDILLIMRKMNDVLNVGGYMYIAVKEKKADEDGEMVVKDSDYGFEIQRFFSYFNMDELEKYFNDLNMEIIYKARASIGKRGWLQIIGKKVN